MHNLDIQCLQPLFRESFQHEAYIPECRASAADCVPGQTINTGIFKEPISGPVQLRTLNLDGDRQADLTVHGGPNKAVYGYPSEHYPFLA